MPSRDVIFRIIGEDAASPAFGKAAASAEGAAARMSRASEKMHAAGRRMTMGITLPLLAIGAESIHVATQFNSAMTRIQTQAGGSAKDVKTLSREVLQLKTAQQGPVDLANSLYHLKSVGMSNVDAMKALRQSSDLAAVGHANLEDTTNALAGAWRTGIRGAKDFHQAVQTLNAGIGAGNMSMTDLVGALGTGILPTAKTFGLTLKDVVSSLALFTDEGVPADAAATRLRMTMSLLGAPSKAAEAQLAKIHLTGLKLANDMRKPNGLIVAVSDLKKHLDASGLSASKQSILLSHAFGGGRSSSAILSMLNNLDVLRGKQEQVTRGMAKYNADVKAQAATPEAQFKTQIANLERAGVILGTQLLPAAAGTAHQITRLVQDFTSLSPATRGWLIDAAKVAIVVGPAVAILGRLGGMFVAVGTRAKRAAQWMAAPYKQSASEAAAAAARIEYTNAQNTADNDLTAAAVARAKASEAQAAEDAAVRIAAAAEQEGAALSGLSTEAALAAIDFAAAMQSEADEAERAALRSSAAATLMQTRLAEASAGVERSAMGMQAALGGAGIGLAVGTLTRNASTSVKTLGVLGSALAGAGMGATMGPWGALIGGITGGLGAMASAFIGSGHSADQASQQAQAALRAEKGAVDSLYQSLLSVNGAYNDQYKGIVTNKLANDGTLAAAQRAHVNPALVVRAAMGDTKAVAKVQRKIAVDIYGNGKQGVGYTATGQPYMIAGGKHATGGQALLGDLNKEGVEIGKAQQKYNLYVQAQGKSIVSTKDLAKGVAGLAHELRGTGTALTTSNDEQIASSGYANKNTAIVRTNIDAIARHAALMERDGKSVGKVATYWRSNTKALEGSLIKMGFARGAVDRLFAKFSKPPKAVQLNVDAHRARTEIARVQATIDRIKQGREPGVSADTKAGRRVLAQLQADINRLKQYRQPSISADPSAVRNAVATAQYELSTLHDKTVHIYVDKQSLAMVNTSSRAGGKPHARGGYIYGPGTGTSDSIPAWLSNGEYVIPAAQTKRHRALLDAIVHGGMDGYADGGLVGGAGHARPGRSSRGRASVRLHIDLGEQLDTYVRDVVIDELSYEAGRL